MSAARSSLSTTPKDWPGGEAPRERPVRRWHVLHACNDCVTTAAVAEAQIQAGMRPSVMTPEGWYRPGSAAPPSPSLSLVQTWREVRRWRNRFSADAVELWAEVLHAHCFSAAMAGLRGTLAVVYDFMGPVGAGAVAKPGPWLLRSLRIAEQFAISRADAIVVHSQAAWMHALSRGGRADDLFLVPEPVEVAAWEPPPERGSLIVFAPDVFAGGAEASREPLVMVLRAFAMLASEIEDVRLLVEAPPAQAGIVGEEAARADIMDRVEVTAPAERRRAMAAAHIVIAGRAAGEDANPALRAALALGRAVLAADIPQNREITAQGRGCLWYRPNDDFDLARRAAFLARNRDFRAALASSGRQYLHATCGPLAVARKYDEVYRHAFQRCRRGPNDPLRKLEVAQAHW